MFCTPTPISGSSGRATKAAKRDTKEGNTSSSGGPPVEKSGRKSWKNLLGRMEIQDKAEAFGRVDRKIQMRALGRSAEIQAAMLERAPAKTIDNILERSFLNNSSVQ